MSAAGFSLTLHVVTIALLSGCGSAFSLATDGGRADGMSEASTNDAGAPANDSSPPLDSRPPRDAPGSEAGPPSGCPSEAEASKGEACNPANLVCEYGTSNSPACNDLYTCKGSGWLLTQSAGSCPEGPCPAKIEKAIGMCNVPSLECLYTGVGTCICSAGMTSTATWHCFLQIQGCPAPRPRLGEPCTMSGAECDYGQCFGGVKILCEGGYWIEAVGGCPG
jgi:hypothetical protein